MKKYLLLTLLVLVFIIPTTASAACDPADIGCVIVDVNLPNPTGDLADWANGDGADTNPPQPGFGAGVSGGGRNVGIGSGIASYLIAIVYFINYTIIPLLFAIALLAFLIGIVRYFLNPGNVEAKDKAKRTAIYGIAAFVFLVSLFGIVNLFVVGFAFDQEDSICPDYLGSWCGSTGFGSFGGGYRNGEQGIGEFRVPTRFDDDVALVDFGCADGQANNPDCAGRSALADLVFGDFEDEAELTFVAGDPRRINQVPELSPTMSCVDGLQTLQQAANIEGFQGAYLYFDNDDGGSTWVNLTDETSANRIGYDADVVNFSGSGHLLVHTHPKERVTDAGLNMLGHGPSAADHLLMCDDLISDYKFVTVDWDRAWVASNFDESVCPRPASALRDLKLIDTIFALSMVRKNQRNEEFDRLLQSSLVPAQFRSDYRALANVDFEQLNPIEIRDLVSDKLADLGIRSTRFSAVGICQDR